MSTDFQNARISLGVRLRELRVEAGLTARAVSLTCGWQPSKLSKLENGKQTLSLADVEAFVTAVGRPDLAPELSGRVRGMETRYRSWRRQLAGGHRSRQEAGIRETEQTRMIRAFEVARIPGLLQTAEYARSLFILNAEFRQTPRDTEAAVRTRLRRQEALYEPGKAFRFLVSEAALRTLVCPPETMRGQLDRLAGLAGIDTVKLGIIPFGVPMRRTPAHGFWIYDERLVIVENINAELWLDEADDIALYVRAWEWLDEAAVYGPAAQRLIARARAALDTA
ncbi:helix-turn-helix domain-containing protein [Streptomyces sp. RKAG337]|uniref:helix-turn-helix domain-containing protein n=1 Tax=Streptomyces sp. RKAG337 TaxID=2893404 RepID=UPI0020338377|nr:helix-turn-helix transcriptional regulator [Streptomyces sp. RKAG337]MCM2429074.1 helix-turn-helix domain-containing protein [Streptomyces sp. RKAG337]